MFQANERSDVDDVDGKIINNVTMKKAGIYHLLVGYKASNKMNDNLTVH